MDNLCLNFDQGGGSGFESYKCLVYMRKMFKISV